MAMPFGICKVPYSVVPLTLGAIASPRFLPSFVIKAAEHGGRDVVKESFVLSHRSNFSKVSDHALKRVDQKLGKVLKSQIKSYNPMDLLVPEASTGFPFEIKDIPGTLAVNLERDFAGEKIEVLVYNPIYPANSSDINDNSLTESSDDEEHEKRCLSFDKPRIQLTLNITKESGTTLRIYRWTNVGYVGHPEIFIEPGSRVSNEMGFDQEENWREFIQVRGIDGSTGELMMN